MAHCKIQAYKHYFNISECSDLLELLDLLLISFWPGELEIKIYVFKIVLFNVTQSMICINWTMTFKYVIFLNDNIETVNFRNCQIYSFT